MAATDRVTSIDGQKVPATHAEPVVVSDTLELISVSRAIYVGVTGDVKVKMQGEDVVTFTAVPAGSVLPIRVKQVYSTGTTASSLLSLW